MPTRSALVGRVRRVLRPDGALFLGGAETMIGIDDGWDRFVHGGCSYYKPKPKRYRARNETQTELGAARAPRAGVC